MAEYQLHQARDTRANWVSNNPTLGVGEIGYVTDNGGFKVGDGATAWTSLGYSNVPTATSMPASPQLGQRVFRSDHDMTFHWDGTRWVTELLQFNMQHSPRAGNNYLLQTEKNGLLPIPYQGTFSIFIETVEFDSFLTQPSSSWTPYLRAQWTDGGSQSAVISTGSAVTLLGTWEHDSKTVNSVLSATYNVLEYLPIENSGDARYYGGCNVNYRLVGT